MKKLTPPAICLFLLLMNCDDEPSEIIINGNIESGVSFPTKWFNYAGQGRYRAIWDNQTFSSASRSLALKADSLITNDFAYWGQQLCDNIPVGKRLVLRTKVKGDLTGAGISIALRADQTSTSTTGLAFETTQNYQSITGTFDWAEYGVEMVSVPKEAQCLYVFLIMLPNTTGEVYFDDISLVFD